MPDPSRESPAYQIELPVFSGPLELLLHLIEREELDITAISLARVTEQYLAQVERLKQNKIEHLIDFLVVAARLVLIKSRALLPRPPAPLSAEEEEDPTELLLQQLRQYQQFKRAAAWLDARVDAGLRTYLRVAPPPRRESSPDLSGITVNALIAALQEVLARAEKKEESVDVARPRQLTIEGQLAKVRQRLQTQARINFKELLPGGAGKVEVAITLLATLELIKRREVVAYQPYLFGPIEIARAPEPAAIGEEE